MRGGDYVFTAEMGSEKKGTQARGQVRFTVDTPPE